MSSFLQDVRFSLRMIFKTPAMTACAILILALGTGVSVAIYSVASAALLRPLPFDDPQELVWLATSNTAKGWDRMPVSRANFEDWRRDNQVFEELVAVRGAGRNLLLGDEARRLRASEVSPGLFSMLAVRPHLGRLLTVADSEGGGVRAVLLNHGLWSQQFGRDPAIVGKTVQMDDGVYSVVGVLPRDFQFPPGPPSITPDVWMALPATTGEAQASRGRGRISVFGRLADGVDGPRAEQDMNAIAGRLEQAYPDSNQHSGVTIGPMREYYSVRYLRRIFTLLLGAVALVLLITCANVSGLLVTRMAARRSELAVRLAIGASRGALLRQVLVESTLLALAGGGLGMLFAAWGSDALASFYPSGLTAIGEIHLDLSALTFAVVITTAASVIFSLAPAFQVRNPELVDWIKDAAGSSSGRNRLHRCLVVGEVALSIVALVGAGLMIRSFANSTLEDPGFVAEGLLTARLALPAGRYDQAGDGRGYTHFYRRLVEEVEAVPGVESASLTNLLGFGGEGDERYFAVQGKPRPAPEDLPVATYRTVSDNYFSTLRVPLLRGRTFDSRDVAPVVIINRPVAERYFPDENPVGQYLELLSGMGDAIDPDQAVVAEIVGVVEGTKYWRLDRKPFPMIFVPEAQEPRRSMSLVVRGSGPPLDLLPSVRAAVASLDAESPLYRIGTMEGRMSESINSDRFTVFLVSLLGALGLVLAAAGVYATLGHSVSVRVNEIGLRMALGAGRRQVLAMVIKEAAWLVALGASIGVVAALGLGGTMERLLYDVSPTDPATLVLVVGLLGVVGLLAALAPARRASRVDPIVALRLD